MKPGRGRGRDADSEDISVDRVESEPGGLVEVKRASSHIQSVFPSQRRKEFGTSEPF